MTKLISPLESTREIQLARKISSNSETVGIYTFFKASRFGYRKTIFNARKVTYNKYSCIISGMSREMTKMDGRDSAECQNWEIKGHNSHYWKRFKSLKDEKCYSVFSFIKPKKKT